jgi:hypothetical protein
MAFLPDPIGEWNESAPNIQNWPMELKIGILFLNIIILKYSIHSFARGNIKKCTAFSFNKNPFIGWLLGIFLHKNSRICRQFVTVKS